MLNFFKPLQETIQKALDLPISDERKHILQPLIAFIQAKSQAGSEVHLNFICTHNSRRSQFSQIWAKTAAAYFGVPIQTYSGGVEVTAFNPRAVDSLKRSGFQISVQENGSNPYYHIFFSENTGPILAFSKVYDDQANPKANFAAVMTCDHADENCPFISGAEVRIPVLYEDPKAFDDTVLEKEKYEERSLQIASEMLYIFSQIKK
ncbi:arsenate reductase [Algoriphagus boseongensis]|uniref:Arsenate reductase n=1 Tax=Algoriphagus boseongensis TaxID=1442587 RepID=A0A4R6T6P6_9BACT|nr:protein-tyrosine-phosphatase [Algoriphagus boseongensis]TDQ17226.1 arsenate reductase [Algoriphagus boseongensis]